MKSCLIKGNLQVEAKTSSANLSQRTSGHQPTAIGYVAGNWLFSIVKKHRLDRAAFTCKKYVCQRFSASAVHA